MLGKNKARIIPIILLAVSLVIIPSLKGLGIEVAEAQKIAVAVGGDFNCKSQEGAATIRTIDQTNLPFIPLGDYGYDKVQCWIDLVENIAEDGNLVRCVIGNHELVVKGDMQKIIKFCKNNSNGSFAISIGRVFFIGINLYVPWKAGTEQYKYINTTLANAQKSGKYDIIVANTHELMKTFKTNGGHPATKGYLQTYEPLFKKYGVKVVNQAHTHVQAIRQGSITYTICGTGGEMRDKLIPGEGSTWLGKTATEKGFCVEEFDGKHSNLIMVNQKGIERDCDFPKDKQCRFKMS